MFCEKCGSQIPDDSKFCTGCGAVIAADAAPAAAAAVATAAKPITLSKKTITIGVAVIAVVLAVIILISVINSLPQKVVLDDYIHISYIGLSTKGEAELNIDWDQMALDAADNDEDEASELYYVFRQNLKISLDNYSDLTNGDELHITAEWDAKVFEKYDLKLKLKNAVVTVAGLQEPVYLDLFADLEITYSGYAPNADVTVTYVGDNEFIKNYVYYYTSGGYDLSEGSTFTIEASFSEYTAESQGYIINESSKEITATGVPQPVELDIFADLTITYEGCAPYSTAKVAYTGDNEFIKNYVYFYVYNGSNLSEGSVFTVEASYSEWRANEYGYTISASSKEYTASNLPQPVELDVFQYVDVTFSGTEGLGKASYTINSDDYFIKYCLNFSFNKGTNLTGGETIALTYTVDSWVDPLKYGYTIGVTSKQFTVPALGKEATSFNDLSAEGQAAVLAKLDELTKLYLTKESTDNKTGSMKLQNTGYSSGNELTHASAVENIELHSVITGGYTSWGWGYRYMVFVYTFDIVNHPNIVDNNSSVADACVYFYVDDPVAAANGHLEGDLSELVEVNTKVYMSYEDLENDFLYKFTTKDTYIPE